MRSWTVATFGFLLAFAPVVTTDHAFADAPHATNPGPPIKVELTFRIPDIQSATLSNGIRVVFVERHQIPLVAVQVFSTIGAADAPPGIAELASRSAVASASHAHFYRTYKRFNMAGAELRAFAGARLSGASTRAMAPYFEDAVADLAEVVRVEFPDGDIVRQAREQAIDSLKKAESSSATYAARELLYPVSHPYHYSDSGTVGAIRSVDASALRPFWARAFTAKNVTICAAGDVTLARLVAALEKAFGTLPQGQAAPPSAPVAPALEAKRGVTFIDDPGGTQARVAVVAHGLPRLHPDYMGLYLTGRLIDGVLHNRVREKYGSTYGVDAYLESERGTPPFWVHGSLENAQVASSLNEILKAIGDVRDGKISKADLEHSRITALNHIARSFETTSATASLLAGSLSVGVTPEAIRDIPTRIGAVTFEQVQALATKHLAPDLLRIVVVGDAKALVPQIEKAGLGPVEIQGAPPPSKKPPPNPVAER